ncbi:hypothetical protein [Shewanella sp. YIC-542]|uniref:hypothetical protein n=1 Tax=Shewanella mytili TaxID=3377111 RepID=UPI00398F5983
MKKEASASFFVFNANAAQPLILPSSFKYITPVNQFVIAIVAKWARLPSLRSE